MDNDTTSRLRRLSDWAERFEAKVEKTESCWNWLGSTNGSGYGTFLFGSRSDSTRENVGAHRFAYELANGPIPDGLEIHHECFTRSCVNPSHLALVTRSQNLKEHPSDFVPVKSRVERCPSGHLYDEANTYLKSLPNGKDARCCRECGRIANRTYYARKQADLAEGRTR